jgi:flagellar biosynthesis/type III secretory pathway protein FliH
METASGNTVLHLKRPLKSLRVTYFGPEKVAEEDAAARESAAYEKGRRDAEEATRRQIVQARAEMKQLQDQVLKSLQDKYAQLAEELDSALPDLVLAIVNKVWNGLTLSREDILRSIDAALAEVGSDVKGLHLRLAPADAALLQEKEAFQQRYPDLTLSTDAQLKSGDVVVESRFGIVDSRVATRLSKVEGEIRKAHQ